MPRELVTPQHVKQKGKIALGLGRDRAVSVETVVRIVGCEVVAPVLETEGRISDDAVVGKESARFIYEAGLGDDVPGLKPGGSQAVKQQVQLANGQGPEVALLAVEGQVAVVAALLSHVLGGIDEHAAGAEGRVTDAHPLLGLQQFDNEPNHGARGVKLATLLTGIVGELVDEVLVGIPQDVAGPRSFLLQVLVPQVKGVEVVEQAANNPFPIGRAPLAFAHRSNWRPSGRHRASGWLPQ